MSFWFRDCFYERRISGNTLHFDWIRDRKRICPYHSPTSYSCRFLWLPWNTCWHGIPLSPLFLLLTLLQLDGEPNKQQFAGKAAKEMNEETLLEIKDTELYDLTYMAYGDKYKGMYPSAGGCDEVLSFPLPLFLPFLPFSLFSFSLSFLIATALFFLSDSLLFLPFYIFWLTCIPLL